MLARLLQLDADMTGRMQQFARHPRQQLLFAKLGSLGRSGGRRCGANYPQIADSPPTRKGGFYYRPALCGHRHRGAGCQPAWKVDGRIGPTCPTAIHKSLGHDDWPKALCRLQRLDTLASSLLRAWNRLRKRSDIFRSMVYNHIDEKYGLEATARDAARESRTNSPQCARTGRPAARPHARPAMRRSWTFCEARRMGLAERRARPHPRPLSRQRASTRVHPISSSPD